MKRLLIATDSFLPRWDGISRFLSEIIPRLASKYRITVVAPDYRRKKVRFQGVHIIRIPLLKLTIGDYTPSIVDLQRIKHLVSTHDIIFTQSIGPIGAPAIYYAAKQKKKVVAFIHAIDWELVSKSIRRFNESAHALVKKVACYLYNKCSIIIVPAQEVKELLQREKIMPQQRIVHVGVDAEYFRPGAGNGKKKLTIGYVGRIGREKDLLTLEKAFSFLRRKNKNLRLNIVGTGVPGVMRQLRRKGVTLLGNRDDVGPLYQKMDIFVLPSLTETSSIATMEAMATGLPVVVTPVGFLRSYIKEGFNGMFFPPGNWQKLAEKLEILIQNPKLREKLGKNARRTVLERFQWEKTVRGIRKALG